MFLFLLLSLWPTWAIFPATWTSSYQEHGFFVAALVAWLIIRDRGKLRLAEHEPFPAAWLPLALLSGVWFGAVVMNVRLVHEATLILLLTTWALATYGWNARRTIFAIGLTALLAVPFWGVGVPILQRATVLASGGATRLLGIQADIGRNSVTISSGTFLIEEGCAGLNYLMGGLVLGAAYGHLFVRRWQTQLKIVALFGGIAIVGNWIRVAVLIVLGEVSAMQSPYIADHLWQGWLIFTLLMAPAFILAGRIERRDAGKPSEVVVEPGALAKTEGRSARRDIAVASICAALGPALFMGLSVIPRRATLDSDIADIGVADTWSAVEQPTEGLWTPSFTGIDRTSAWLLRSGNSEVEAVRHYFIAQRQGEELVQFENQIAPDSLVVGRRLLGPVGTSRRLVNETLVMDDGAPRLVWHWYRVSRVDTPSETRAKLLEIPAFFLRLPASELVTLSARCEPNDCTDAAKALASSLGATS